MKKMLQKALLIAAIALVGLNNLNAQVKVGNNPTTLDARSLLELESTDKALWLPRLTTTQRDAQATWKAGMFIYNSTDSCVQMFNGTIWNCLAKGSGTAWQLTGNAGTNSATNFMGTTDNQDVVFKRNNLKAGLLSERNTAFGVSALNSYVGSSNNTALGAQSLKSLTSGYSNVAVGDLALRDMVSGIRNTAVGAVAMVFQTGGDWNTMVGQSAMYYTTNRASSYNTGVGYEALARTNGNYNTAIGYGTWDTYDGDSSIFIGSRVGPRAGTSVNKQLNIGDWIFGVNGRIGIGINATNPTNQLHIAGTNNPLRLEGLQSGAATDSIVTVDATGVLRQRSTVSLSTNNWSITGNAGTNSATNFMGTTDNQDVVFKRNNLKAGLLSERNTAFGVSALNSYVGSSNNTALGAQSLKSLTSGYSNVAVGDLALRDMVSGIRNTAVGAVAMVFQTGGDWNTMVGQSAMYYTTNRASSYNTGVGYEALARTNGNYNTAIGYGTWDTYDGDSSIFIGSRVGPRAGTSVNKQLNIGDWVYGVNGRIGIGTNATNPTNQLHIAGTANPLRLEGLQSGAATDSILTADATGVVRQRSVASLQDVRMVGTNNHITQDAGVGSNGTSVGTGSNNIAFGKGSFRSNTSSIDNIALGKDALANNSTGNNNIALGAGSLFSHTTGSWNVVLGNNAAKANVSGFENVVIGYGADEKNTSGETNVIIGAAANGDATSGNENTMVGWGSGYYNYTGSGNTFLGFQSGGEAQNGSNNTVIGANTMFNVGGINNSTVIGYGAQVSASNSLILGGSGIKVGIGTTAPQSEFHVVGTGAIIVPVGTTAQRPATAVTGMIRFNSSTGKFEGFDGITWSNLN